MVRLAAHRGFTMYEENTLLGVVTAAARGWIAETDLVFVDGQWVLGHDHPSTAPPRRHPPDRARHLFAVLHRLSRRSRLILDIKWSDLWNAPLERERAIASLAALLNRYARAARDWSVQASRPDLLVALADRLVPSLRRTIRLGLLVLDASAPLPAGLPIDYVMVDAHHTRPEDYERFREAGLSIAVYGIRTEADLHALIKHGDIDRFRVVVCDIPYA